MVAVTWEDHKVLWSSLFGHLFVGDPDSGEPCGQGVLALVLIKQHFLKSIGGHSPSDGQFLQAKGNGNDCRCGSSAFTEPSHGSTRLNPE